MEIKELQPFVLLIVLVGMILGVGILTLDKFGTATRETTDVINETITVASSTATLTYNNITSVTYFGNWTNVTIATFTSGDIFMGSASYDNIYGGNLLNITKGGLVTFSRNMSNGKYNVSYVYSRATATTAALESTTTELGGISTNWLGLIITIAVLAIILTMVIRSFTSRR